MFKSFINNVDNLQNNRPKNAFDLSTPPKHLLTTIFFAPPSKTIDTSNTYCYYCYFIIFKT